MKANHTDVAAQENVRIVRKDVIDQDARHAKEAHPKNAGTVNVHEKEVDATMKVEAHTETADREAAIAMLREQAVLVIAAAITTVKGNKNINFF